jgi:hypothetical protein
MKHVTRSSPCKDIKLFAGLVASVHEIADDSFFLSQLFLNFSTFFLSSFLSLFFKLYQEHTRREYDQQLNTDSYGLKLNKTH